MVDLDAVARQWRLPAEIALDLCSLALYDIVIYADDSYSMQGENWVRVQRASTAGSSTLASRDSINLSSCGQEQLKVARLMHIRAALVVSSDSQPSIQGHHKLKPTNTFSPGLEQGGCTGEGQGQGQGNSNLGQRHTTWFGGMVGWMQWCGLGD